MQLRYLPAFAEFLLNHKLVDYIRVQLRFSREVKLPLLRIFEKMSDEQIIEFSIASNTEFLNSIIKGSAAEHIAASQVKWLNNQLEFIDKYGIAAEDISLVSYIRKKAMMAFLPEYTGIMADALAIIQEIDALNLESDLSATNTYINILKDKVQEHSYFIERITDTSPGIIYVFDLLEKKEIYANKMMTQLLGYEPHEWQQLEDSFVDALIHPDDVSLILENQAAFADTPDGAVRTIKYRIKDKSGSYRWMQTFESVFKRTEAGEPWQVIGIALDISTEKKTADQLKQREEQLLEAQAIAHMGSFVWNMQTDEREATPEVYHILEVEPGMTVEAFINRVHAADRERLQTAFDKSVRYQEPLDEEVRYICGGREKIIWFKCNSRPNQRGEIIVQGTMLDVTERNIMLQRLQRSEAINKKAQALTHLGNWTWDLQLNRLEWSDELYRIYQLEPGSAITHELIASYNHPDDAERIQQIVSDSAKTKQPYDFYYRIRFADGAIKTLHAIGEVLANQDGVAYKMIGTLQDVTERELLIERLKRSEQLYKQAQAIAHLGNWIYDLRHEKIFWTDELYRIYGLEPKQDALTWNSFLEGVIEEDREMVTAFATESLKSGKPFEMYHRICRRNDGAVRTVHIRGEGLADETGKVYQLFGTTQDVTEQQEIEQELRENQNFIKKIADATPSIITSYNVTTGQFRFVSQGMRSLLGYDPEEAMDKGVAFFSALIHPDDAAMVMERNAAALEMANAPDYDDQEMVVDFQYRMQRADGVYRWFHTFGTVFDRNSKGLVENVLNISIDITDRVAAEQTVAEQQKFISHIAEASPTILYLFDLEQKRFLYLNKEVTEVLGYTPEEIIAAGDRVYTFLHPEDTIKSPDTYVKYKHEGAATMHQFEGRIKSKEGDWKWLLTREVVFRRNEEGKAVQVLGSALDITDRKEMERSLSKKNTELQQSNANLEEFAYVASHDLQEPLRKISIFGDRLLTAHLQHLPDDGQTFLQKIVDSSRRMQAMINDLLSVSLLSGDKTFERTSLAGVVHEVLQTLEHKIEATGASVTVSKLPAMDMVPSQIRQLFQNLISNSLKFVHPQRKPEIIIEGTPVNSARAMQLNLSPVKQYYEVTVTDNGIGFENEYASKIFTIFQRLHGRSEYEGTGIGLAICKKIVEIHQGLIYADGSPGKGARFTMVLPVQR